MTEIIIIEHLDIDEQINLLKKLTKEYLLLFHVFQNELKQSYFSNLQYSIIHSGEQNIIKFLDPPEAESNWVCFNNYDSLYKYLSNNEGFYKVISIMPDKKVEEYNILIEAEENFSVEDNKTCNALFVTRNTSDN